MSQGPKNNNFTSLFLLKYNKAGKEIKYLTGWELINDQSKLFKLCLSDILRTDPFPAFFSLNKKII